MRLLLCTDLDRTLIPNGHAPESPGARDLFHRLAVRPEITLAYISGRDSDRIRGAIDEYSLPLPDYVVADVGTSLYVVRSHRDWDRNLQWDANIGRDEEIGESGWLTGALDAVTFLQPQEASRQGRFKASFYFPAAMPEAEVVEAVQTRLAERKIPATVVTSIDDLRGIGLLDVLPERASKRHAIGFLMQTYRFTVEETVFCGDSGNDLSVLASTVPGVLVANATAAVRVQALTLAARAGTEKALYLATGSFMCMNGNYAAGIVEGICHFHPEIAGWISSMSHADAPDA